MAKKVALESRTERYLEIFRSLTDEEQHLVNQALEQVARVKNKSNTTEDALAKALAGRDFSDRERIQLEMETLAHHFLNRRQLLDGSFTAPQVAKLLRTSRQTPHDRLASQTLLAIKDNGMLRFPSWQFDPAGPDGVIDGLPQVLKALQMSDYAKLNWLTRPTPYLDNLTPIEILKRGEKERVIQEATDAGAGQWC